MTSEEISKYAMNGVMPDVELNCAEKCLFWELKDIYRRYRDKEISRDEGERLKAEAIKRLKADNDTLKYAKKIVEFHSKMWKEIEEAGSTYCKEPTIEHADAFVKAVYRVGRRGEGIG